MPRVRADDYDTKSRAILDSAAALFAKVGYPNAKMQDVAKACGATKSMLYHYYPTKDDLLFEMLEDHLERLIGSIDEAMNSGGTQQQRFLRFVETYTQKSAQSRRRHVIAMNDVKFLPKAQQGPLLALERRVIEQVTEMLRAVHSGLDEDIYKPYAMMLLGMLNWTDYWFKPNGAMKPEELSERMSRLFLKGFLAERPGD